MAAKRKSIAKKTSIKKSAKKTSKAKFYMYGDVCDHFGGKDKVSVALPVDLLTDYLNAAIACDTTDDEDGSAEKTMDTIRATVSKRTSKLVGNILAYNASAAEDARDILNAIKRGKGVGTGECETVAGWGPTKTVAKAQYDALQDDESEEDYDW